jgi:hypothetical protein
VSDDKNKKAKRLHRTANAIKKQVRIAKSLGTTHTHNQPHRYAKRHALDCGNPKCQVCHSEKVFNKPTLQDRKFIEAHKGEDS